MPTDSDKRTAVANTAAVLFPFDGSRSKFSIQNPLASPIYISKTNPPTLAPPAIKVPKAGDAGDGEHTIDGDGYEAWYYITAASGDFTVIWW